jgi:hypothetical protein
MQLISGFVNSYLKLTSAEHQRFKQAVEQIAPVEREAVMQVMNEWIEEGMELGDRRGKAELVTRLLRRRFGPPPASMTAQIKALSGDKLTDLAEALLDFPDLAAAQAWIDSHA